ncbi:hypothetical protein SAMN05421578_1088 [Paenibacillus macquariensis]|uniref:Transposase n=1 Tax=Paenibacillus macquariensis TaxID=948756 RepID=A0ABY1K2N9_9BACL|nr:hypothetical protein SAMN05421578_1088 [Paenibacillus macquariensis]
MSYFKLTQFVLDLLDYMELRVNLPSRLIHDE